MRDSTSMPCMICSASVGSSARTVYDTSSCAVWNRRLSLPYTRNSVYRAKGGGELGEGKGTRTLRERVSLGLVWL